MTTSPKLVSVVDHDPTLKRTSIVYHELMIIFWICGRILLQYMYAVRVFVHFVLLISGYYANYLHVHVHVNRSLSHYIHFLHV